MSFDLFGYNGVLELDQPVVNKLLCSFAYDRYLVEIGGQITDGDFFTVAAAVDGGNVHVYLELARPFVHMSAADGSNKVTLHLPFSDVSVFLTRDGISQRISAPTLALVLFGVSIQKTQQGLTIDFSTLTGDNVGLMLIKVLPGPTDVGGSQDHPDLTLLVDDTTLGSLLKDPEHPNAPPVIKAADLRTKLASFLRGGGLGSTAIPVAAGGLNSELAQWDLMLFGTANDRDINDTPGPAGADLLLFQDPQHGVGERTQAGFILPTAPDQPGYGWSANLSVAALSDGIQAALDLDPYWVQGGTNNTPGNPYGYLVVPGMQQAGYALPSGPGKVTLDAAQNGQVKVDFAADALTPHSRAHVSNLTGGARVDFVADGNGAASISIRADAGERLALTVDAVSLPGDSATVVWRPQISFHEGEIHASAHYIHQLPHWCDIEGDASARIALSADRSQPFGVSVTVLDANSSTPWWFYMIAWLGPGLVGQDVFAPILLALLPTITHSLAQDLIGDKIASKVKALSDQISAPSIENLALVLDQVDVHQTGIQLAGRADAGVMLAWGRQSGLTSQDGVVVQASEPNPVYMRFDWRPSLTSIDITCPVRWAVIRDRPAEMYWSSSYDDLDVTTLGREVATLSRGGSMMAWIELGPGHAKVLFESAPPGNEVLDTSLRITWIAYRGRVDRAVKLLNHLVPKQVGGSQSITLEEKLLTWSGTIDLATIKAFFSDETRALGEEKWFWDGQQVTDQGLAVPGGSVILDPANRRLLVTLDQVGLLDGPDPQASGHWVEFQGVDVFGHALNNKILVFTPPIVVSPRPIAFVPPFRIDPLADPIRDRMTEDPGLAAVFTTLSAQLGKTAAAGVVRLLGDAAATGTATLDGATALAILSVLSQARITGVVTGRLPGSHDTAARASY